MTYEEALAYLQSSAGVKLGLSRVRELTERLGCPQEVPHVLHIAGTNGKGSVGAMLSGILTAAGYRTGHFSTPALLTPCDMFRINTQTVSEAHFARALTQVRAQAEHMADAPTEFELLAACAYHLFADCRFAVVECCMGGDTDCTNVIDAPCLSIITGIALDHCAYLGAHAEEIAFHKAGILKPGCQALVNDTCMSPGVLAVIRERARAIGAPLHTVSTCTGTGEAPTLDGTVYRFDGKEYRLSLPGAYQIRNADTVLHAVSLLRTQGIVIPEEAVQEGLSQITWPGRFEVLHRTPDILFDGAHNPDGILQLRESLVQVFGPAAKAVLVAGVMADKDYAAYPELLHAQTDCVFTVTPDNPRALPADALARTFRACSIPAAACKGVPQAVRCALERAEVQHLPVLGMGSLYLYRDFCEAVSGLLL
ncbi:MAG: bifunctional folylpolyglutamate synthase/dihydrofolate synthase [Oscillospiraceae bacterium]|nr:bifunctional folylpolyglutamate synthase/dihydrofolate synthase [Oscillospiraceae bacterium]